MLSVIIPTLNEAGAIGATLDALAKLRGSIEVIVVDGGSKDGTTAIARGGGARVHIAPQGRGQQMHAGSRHARGQVLWFLHADTHPPADAVEQIGRALDDAEVVGGIFTLKFGGNSCAARILTWVYPYLGRLGLCYGDAAVFVRHEAYEQVGGFQPFPLFEDLDLVRRLKRRGRFIRLPSQVITSSRRFERRSFPLTLAHWTFLQVLYWLGVKPRVLGRLYPPLRSRR